MAALDSRIGPAEIVHLEFVERQDTGSIAVVSSAGKNPSFCQENRGKQW